MESVHRRDKSPISGLTHSEWDTYLKRYMTKYPFVSEQDLAYIRDSVNEIVFPKVRFEFLAKDRLHQKAVQIKHGKNALYATPLFMVLSVHVELLPKLKRKAFWAYGEITSHRGFFNNIDYIYKREFQDVEYIGRDGGNLTINGPSPSCSSNNACYILESSKLSIKLYDDSQKILANGCIQMSHSKNEFEEVKEEKVDIDGCSFILKYVSIPMAVYAFLELEISNKLYLGKDAVLRDSVKVYGKVVATYKNTFGNYNSEEIVLFEKNANEYEQVVLGSKTNLFSSRRCWVALPAYSWLHVRIDLFESETKKPILNKDVELETDFSRGNFEHFIDGEFFIRLIAAWCVPRSLRHFQDGDDSGQGEPEDGDDSGQGKREDGDGSGQGEPEDVGADGVQTSGIRELRAPGKLFPAFEVFSVLICYNKNPPLTIYGLLQLAFGRGPDSYNRRVDIFKRNKEDPLSLFGRGNTIPLTDGSIRYSTLYPLAVICDLKDTLDKLSIKGYQWSDHDWLLRRNVPLCSVFRGDHGFAALHYAIFPTAVQANLKVFYLESGLKRGGIPVFGSFYAEYNDFYYSSEYEKKCYKIVFFESVSEDSMQVLADGLVPLFRSSFVGPKDSSFMFAVDLMIGTQRFSGQKNIEISEGSMSIKVGECEVEINLEWGEKK